MPRRRDHLIARSQQPQEPRLRRFHSGSHPEPPQPTGRTRWPARPRACAAWSRGMHAARSSSTWHKTGGRARNQRTSSHVVLRPLPDQARSRCPAGGLPGGCPPRMGAAVCVRLAAIRLPDRGRGHASVMQREHPSPTAPGASSSLEPTASIWSVAVDTSPARGSSAGTHRATRPDVRLLAAGELFDGARDACFEVKNFGP
jgi:hypothetical protein